MKTLLNIIILPILLMNAMIVNAQFPMWDTGDDKREWVIGNTQKTDRGYLLEFTLNNESISNWTELVTQQYYQVGNVDLDVFIKLNLDNIANGCETFTSEINESSASNIIAIWSHEGCGGFPATREIFRVVKLDDGVLIMRYAVYTKKTDLSFFQKWLTIIKEAHVKNGM